MIEKIKKIIEHKLFKTFILFSMFRAIYGAIVLIVSYYLTTSYEDGLMFTILFLIISIVLSRIVFKRIKPKFNL